jgi:hypothetical protein
LFRARSLKLSIWTDPLASQGNDKARPVPLREGKRNSKTEGAADESGAARMAGSSRFIAMKQV